MSFEELNLTVTQGQMEVTVRRLQTMTIHFNPKVSRYYVTNDRDGSFRSGGHSSLDEAVKMNEREDMRRIGL